MGWWMSPLWPPHLSYREVLWWENVLDGGEPVLWALSAAFFLLMVPGSAVFLKAFPLLLLGSVWMSGAGELSLGFAGPPPLPAISMDTTVLFKVSQLPLLGSTKMGRWKGRCLFWGGTVLLPLTLQAVLWGLQPEFSTTTTFTGAKVDANCVHVYYPYFSPHSTSLTYPNIPTFKCTDAWILQARMCVEQGILCRVMVRLVNLREERKASSHSTIMLMTYSLDFCFLIWIWDYLK